MAQYIQTVSGSASTAANVRRITAVATAHASNTTSDFYSSPVYTDTFTAPSTSDSAYGVGIFLTSNGQSSGTVLRATLQEDAGAGSVAQPTNGATYTVVRGDTLSGIGAKTGVKWQDIASINGISDPYIIYPGQVLRLGGGVPQAPATYTVVSGDYLVRIGEKTGKKWQDIAAVNGIGAPYTIYPGQVLRLP